LSVAYVIFSLKNSDDKITVSCPVLNISDTGACVVISKETISNIDLQNKIIINIGTFYYESTAKNARVYAKKRLNNDELYALGLQFNN
jgi:hypothetical protein